MTRADDANTHAVSPVLMALALKAPAEPPASSFAPAPAAIPIARILMAPSKNFRCLNVLLTILLSCIVAIVVHLSSIRETKRMASPLSGEDSK